MADNAFDLIVIGAGPGGYVAAIRAAQLGMKVACVEADKLGGVCNNVGCIPTKAMLESAKYAKKVGALADFGIMVGEVKLDIVAAAKRSRKVADQGSRGVAFLFKKHKIEAVGGWARLAGGGVAGPGRGRGPDGQAPAGGAARGSGAGGPGPPRPRGGQTREMVKSVERRELHAGAGRRQEYERENLPRLFAHGDARRNHREAAGHCLPGLGRRLEPGGLRAARAGESGPAAFRASRFDHRRCLTLSLPIRGWPGPATLL